MPHLLSVKLYQGIIHDSLSITERKCKPRKGVQCVSKLDSLFRVEDVSAIASKRQASDGRAH